MTHLFRLKADLLKDEKKFESEELLEDLEENLKEPEDEDEESEEVEPESEVQQSFPSERTDRRQLSGVFTKVEWSEGVVNFDNGGGASDKAQEYLDKFGATNLVYDPYNRTNGHNREVLAQVRETPADTSTISNVLNVIKEPEVRMDVMLRSKHCVRPGGIIYVWCYEGDGSGVGRETLEDSWQTNLKLKAYLPEVQRVWPNARVQRGIIVATN